MSVTLFLWLEYCNCYKWEQSWHSAGRDICQAHHRFPEQHKTLINTCPHQMIFTSTFCLLQWNNIIGLDTTGGNCSLKSKQKSYKSICLVSVCFFLSAGSIQNPILIPILVMSSRGSHSWLESRHVKYLKEKESSADKEKPLFAIQFK